MDSSDDSEQENIVEINEENRNIQGKFHRGFVSGWDDDDDEGIEEEEKPHESGEKEILWAADNNDLEKVKKWVTTNPDLTKSTDKDGYTPLHRAAYNNHLEILNVLLDHNADVNARTIDGWTPLHSACHWNAAPCAERLIACGADVNAKSNGGITPLHLAASNPQGIEALQALLLHPNIDPSILNNSSETAHELAIRKGRLGKYFEATEPCFNYI